MYIVNYIYPQDLLEECTNIGPRFQTFLLEHLDQYLEDRIARLCYASYDSGHEGVPNSHCIGLCSNIAKYRKGVMDLVREVSEPYFDALYLEEDGDRKGKQP